MLQFAQASFPEMYERFLVGPLFRPFAEDMVSRLRIGAGDRVLDVACGTGVVARLARERVGASGRVVGIDVNPGMLAVARAQDAGVEYREGDAAAPPLGKSERFDVVVCQQGFQFFMNAEGALRAMRRALEAGGRLGLSTWRSDEELPFLRELRRIAEQTVGPIADRRHALGETGPIESMLEAAGFTDVATARVSKAIRFDDGSVFVRLNAMALVGMSAAGRAMSDAEQQHAADTITAQSRDLVAANSAVGGLTYEIATNVITARG